METLLLEQCKQARPSPLAGPVGGGRCVERRALHARRGIAGSDGDRDAVRASVAQLGGGFAKDARRGEKFEIALLRVDGRDAFFEGGGQEINGRMTYGPEDIVAFRAKGGSGWKVFNLQVRGDVPDAAEVAQLRASLPPDYPLSIVKPFWRDLLLKVQHSP